MVKCTCEDKKCEQRIFIDTGSGTLNIDRFDGKTTVIYLDANETVKLINELKKFLLSKLDA